MRPRALICAAGPHELPRWPRQAWVVGPRSRPALVCGWSCAISWLTNQQYAEAEAPRVVAFRHPLRALELGQTTTATGTAG